MIGRYHLKIQDGNTGSSFMKKWIYLIPNTKILKKKLWCEMSLSYTHMHALTQKYTYAHTYISVQNE